MKFLISFVSFLLCAGILAFGGYQTVQESNFEEMIEKFEVAIESTPVVPEVPGDSPVVPEAPGGEDKPGNDGGDVGGDIGGDVGGDVGGEDNPGNDNPGNDNPGNDNTGNDNDDDDNNNVADGGTLGLVGGMLDGINEGYNYATSDTNQSLIQNQIEQNVDTSTESGQTAADVGSSVIENLYKELDKTEENGEGKTIEEKTEERNQIVEETKKGLEGAETLLGAANGEDISSEDIGAAVEDMASSSVIVNAGNDMMEDDDLKQNVQDVINNLPEETKQQVSDNLMSKYEEQIAQDAEKAEALKNFASNAGFDTSNWNISGGFNPDDYQ